MTLQIRILSEDHKNNLTLEDVTNIFLEKHGNNVLSVTPFNNNILIVFEEFD
jgi:hypothetical protein